MVRTSHRLYDEAVGSPLLKARVLTLLAEGDLFTLSDKGMLCSSLHVPFLFSGFILFFAGPPPLC